ncbi:adenylosuccinate lyase [Alteribacillus sp. YIM 98480]|uniref:adenylosuccinate lyase n=1 Tax=Alteribacillus sp. YIM 98480 TaxID=2606599 RepID=UPI00131C910D|nr:adenylosuccinate lyase [Alteribacillus sp. YIM 98480]
MRSHIIDSKIFGDQFSTEEMRLIFSEENMINKWIEVEVALAEAEAKLGIIPADAVHEIKQKGKVELFNFDQIKQGVDKTWHPLVPFIREFKSLCEDEAGEYIHWGVTTQDVMDTGMVLQIKEAFKVIEKELEDLQEILCELAKKHSDTVMAGRTHGQHALPITFGYKVAVWASEVNRHVSRLNNLKESVLTGNIAGAVGTLASLGEDGLKVQSEVNSYLGLEVPDIAWHVSRDRFADVTSFLGILGGTFGKISNEIIQLQKTEIAEVEEPFEFGRIGSSTMPQKRNPMACEAVGAVCRLLRSQSSLGIEAMVQEHERDMGPWQAEWEFIPEMFMLSASVLHHMKWILKDLHVYSSTMRKNLEKSNGLIMSEAVMMHLAETLGRQKAHDEVYQVAMKAFEENISLKDALKSNQEIADILSPPEIEELLNPLNYTGSSKEFVENVISKIQGYK